MFDREICNVVRDINNTFQKRSWTAPMLISQSADKSSSDQTRERCDWQTSADLSSPDQTRERFGWRSFGFWAVTVLMAVRNEDLIYEYIYKGTHDYKNNV